MALRTGDQLNWFANELYICNCEDVKAWSFIEGWKRRSGVGRSEEHVGANGGAPVTGVDLVLVGYHRFAGVEIKDLDAVFWLRAGYKVYFRGKGVRGSSVAIWGLCRSIVWR